ncbi:uncharacterized protein LOC26536330 [Drosophila yakuba]|uniref:Uncharacterized protein n=1 Tax=Drosophila yakuba TaxID=7245 RepID=A0A0R1EG17_DROYA|nr:uncharacterized protein LOC26536330 [Drosophila yakuba]KRK07027.1 uncharacterized protein Dyak_GE29149 [Drosophila yakuba]
MCCAPMSAPSMCCPPAGHVPWQPMHPATVYQCCPSAKCTLCCHNESKHECHCSCQRNRHIVEAFSCLFRVSKFQILTTLFLLAYHESRPLPRYPRDRTWSVMENVKAPYTELHDLRIYDSMFDRCGHRIDPLDRRNTYKLLRLIFLGPVLVPEQRTQLLAMLYKLNARAACPVDLAGLLSVVQHVKLDELVCGILEQDGRAKRFHSGRQCLELCNLYQKVVATDKEAVIKKRRRRREKSKSKDADAQKKPRRTITAQIYCTRRVPEPDDMSSRNEGTTPIVRSTATSLRRSSNRKSWAPANRSSINASEKGSRRGSHNSAGSPKRNKPEAANVGVRMQGGDR